MMFSKIIQDLKIRNFFDKYTKRNPNLIYSKINEIAQFVGSRYEIDLKLHFPNPTKIYVFDSYGTENIGIVVDRLKKKLFHITRNNKI